MKLGAVLGYFGGSKAKTLKSLKHLIKYIAFWPMTPPRELSDSRFSGCSCSKNLSFTKLKQSVVENMIFYKK